VFSQTSTAAALRRLPDLLDVLFGAQDREVALEPALLADFAVIGIAQLRGVHPSRPRPW